MRMSFVSNLGMLLKSIEHHGVVPVLVLVSQTAMHADEPKPNTSGRAEDPKNRMIPISTLRHTRESTRLYLNPGSP